MTRIITLTKRETTHIQDLQRVIEQEKLEILKRLSPIILIKTGKTYNELITYYVKN